MTTWHTALATPWQTAHDITWKTSVVATWFVLLLLAFWDSANYTWDDLVCPWDAQSEIDVWHTKNPGTWYIEN